ncbi:S8 family serine peptidase [Glycomyces luteolus]|uniref:S8 family serine peptidase n=1 Tax=Glycomyces luteolus TaxID=2670330 RepID=A0A9X3T2S1_9ACTN|nr:S8 family serine peptidase [Glycomyces luteolus]MDA1359110.1 S8 family serine peptidase [Glycomyces luteolus]
MRPSRPSRAADLRRRIAAALAATSTAMAIVVVAVPASARPASAGPFEPFSGGDYIVQFADDPVAVYDGGLPGLERTAPAAGEIIEQHAREVEEYREHLAEVRDAVLAEVPAAEPAAEYDTVFNGVAVELSASEAAELAADERVAGVFPNTVQPLQLDTSPEFLGLSGSDGSWEAEFGGREHAGEGIVVGIVDDGYWPEHPSFAALPEPRPDQDVIDAEWNGECVAGEEEDPADNVTCNNKVIGARWYDTTAFGEEFSGRRSPRGDWAHGTHVGSTAAGTITDLVQDGESHGTISGLAPAARLAFYKACWGSPFNGGGCQTSDTVAAFEDAVNDGVDVINFSIGGSRDTVNDPMSIAMFNAAAAGVFVAASAGNDDASDEGTVAHPAPWVTTVAASTHGRAVEGLLSLGDGQSFPFGNIGGWVSQEKAFDLVMAEAVALDGADPAEARRCLPGTLDEAAAAGRAVACARGGVFFHEKGREVLDAGGVAMIVYNDDPEVDDLRADPAENPILAAHIDVEAGDALEEYASGSADATVTLHPLEAVERTAPEMASFSSDGPTGVPGGGILKPDLTVPGVEILAGYTPDALAGDEDFGIMSGTSMSSPHVAGLAALLKGANPDWSPMAVKSALMTSAFQTDTEGRPIQRGGEDATPFDFGAGHADGQAMFDPGLVYDSGAEDWVAYGCAVGQFQELDGGESCASSEAEHGVVGASDLNYPSITLDGVPGTQTITRTVTNVDDEYAFYVPRIEAPAGFEVTVDRPWLGIAPGKSATFTVTVTRTDAAAGEWSFGALTWCDRYGHEVRSPITARAVDIVAPHEVRGGGSEGAVEIDLQTGFEGTLDIVPSGPVASQVEEFDLANSNGTDFPVDDPSEGEATASFELAVPADAVMGRAAIVDEEYEEGADLDLVVYEKLDDGTLQLVDAPFGADSDEQVDLEPGRTYQVYVHVWDAPTETVDAKVHTWVLPANAEPGLHVDPKSIEAELAGEHPVTASWSGLDPERRYLAALQYFADEQPAGRTVFVLN